MSEVPLGGHHADGGRRSIIDEASGAGVVGRHPYHVASHVIASAPGPLVPRLGRKKRER